MGLWGRSESERVEETKQLYRTISAQLTEISDQLDAHRDTLGVRHSYGLILDYDALLTRLRPEAPSRYDDPRPLGDKDDLKALKQFSIQLEGVGAQLEAGVYDEALRRGVADGAIVYDYTRAPWLPSLDEAAHAAAIGAAENSSPQPEL